MACPQAFPTVRPQAGVGVFCKAQWCALRPMVCPQAGVWVFECSMVRPQADGSPSGWGSGVCETSTVCPQANGLSSDSGCGSYVPCHQWFRPPACLPPNAPPAFPHAGVPQLLLLLLFPPPPPLPVPPPDCPLNVCVLGNGRGVLWGRAPLALAGADAWADAWADA